jgi:hypothetical protein
MNTSRFVGLTLIATSLGSAHAAITAFEDVNILIPTTFEGVYLDLVSNSSATASSSESSAAASYTISSSEPASDQWDFNFFFGGAGIAHNSSANPYREDASDQLSAVQALGIDDTIDGVTATSTGALPLTTPAYGGSGTGSGGGGGISTSGNHLGLNAGQFQSGQQGYIGFVLDQTTTPTYGWMSVTLNNDGTEGVIHSFAFSDEPLDVGAIPEPSTCLLTLVGLAALTRRRRS